MLQRALNVWSASEHGYLDQARCHRPFINALSCRNPCPVAGRSAVRLCRCQGVCQTLIEDIADVLLGPVLTVAAHPEHDRVDAPTGVEPPVAGTVLLQELGSVALAMGGSLEQADLRAVVVGVVRRLQLVDHGHHVVATGRRVGDDHDAGHRPGSVTLSAKEIDILNSLLRRFDRPTRARRNRHLPLA